jgi:hypothetical protein
MAAIAFLVAVVAICALGARYGTDSTQLARGRRRNWL